jgi:hypothetical protein
LIGECICSGRDGVYIIMNGLLILLAVFAVPYVALNVRRLRRGRSWAFTFCQVAKEWEQRERAALLAARAANRGKPPEPVASAHVAGASRRS